MNGLCKVILVLCAMTLVELDAQNNLQVDPPFAAQQHVQGMPQIVIEEGKKSPQYALTCGDNVLQMHSTNPMGQDLTVGGQPRSVMQISYWGANKLGYGAPFLGGDPQINHDSQQNRIILKKAFHAASDTTLDGMFTQTMTVKKDGLVEMNYQYEVPKGTPKIDHGLLFSFRPSRVSKMQVQIDGKDYQFSSKPIVSGIHYVFKGKATTLTFAPDKPSESFTITFPKPVGLYIREKLDAKRSGKMKVQMRATPSRDGSIALELDMRNTSAQSIRTDDSFAGISFWKNDRLHVPDFASSRNLLPNPSFESGLRYYNSNKVWGTWSGKDYPVYTLDQTHGKFGNQCLKVSAWKAYPRPNSLATFVIPTVTGEQYTFSFYARSQRPGQFMQLRCVTGKWLEFPKLRGFTLSEQWKRYSVTFTAPNRAATIMFNVLNTSKQPRVDTFFDGLQLEQNDHATDFVDTTWGSDLLTANPDNFLSPGQVIKARLTLSVAPHSQGQVRYRLRDFYDHERVNGQAKFHADEKGLASIALPLDSKIGTGVFVLQADYMLDDGTTYTDFYRLTCMKPLIGPFKHRSFFGSLASARISRSEAVAKRYTDMGLGSYSYESDPVEDALYRRYDIHHTGSGVFAYGSKGTGELAVRRKAVWQRLENEGYSDALSKDVQQVAYEMVQAYPWIDTWFLQSECNGGGGKLKVVRDRDHTGFAKLILACAAGIKEADSSKRLMFTGGPTNMSPGNGIRQLGNWLEHAKALAPNVKFDAIAIHPYRATPESPDLDADTATFLKMLDQTGYGDVPVYWNEGIYNTPWQIAQWDLDPHKGCSTDHWRCGTPTYDMGWGERISAAYYARSWLVGLKYSDRIKQYNGWSGGAMFLDTRLTGVALQQIPNTLGTLLGNAKFKKDIRFAPHCRTYVFEDQQQRPVAAMWSFFPMTDRGYEPSPKARIIFQNQQPEFIDLMGNRVLVESDPQGVTQIPVSPFPVFLRGKPGSMNAFCQSLTQTRLEGMQQSTLAIRARLQSPKTMQITFTNQVSYPFQGEIQMSLGGQRIKRTLQLSGMASEQMKVQLPQALLTDRINRISFPIKVIEPQGSTFSQHVSLEVLPVVHAKHILIDGKLDDWQDIPSIKLTNAICDRPSGSVASDSALQAMDCKAEYKMAWDDSNLYLCVQVQDDHPRFPPLKTLAGIYKNDSIQVYIDTFGDNDSRAVKQRFDFNDYEYDISMDDQSGKVIVYRRFAPEQQLAGGLDAPKPDSLEPDIKAVVRMTPTGYIYEVAFPRKLIAPLALEKNTFFRVGLTVNDSDQKGYRWALNNLSTSGMNPYTNPESWPGVLLSSQ